MVLSLLRIEMVREIILIRISLVKMTMLIHIRQELVRYRGPEEIQNEIQYSAAPADAVIVEKWNINQNARWKWNFKFRWTK